MAAKKKQPPRKSSGKSSVTMPDNAVVQPHGGYLVPGAGGGPQPGAGRPPEDLRASMRGTLAEILPGLLAKYTAKEIDAVRFADFLAKYGLGTKEEIAVVSADVQERVQRQVSVIASRATWTREDLLAQLSEVWS